MEVGDGGGVVGVGVGGIDSEKVLEAGDWGGNFLLEGEREEKGEREEE